MKDVAKGFFGGDFAKYKLLEIKIKKFDKTVSFTTILVYNHHKMRGNT